MYKQTQRYKYKNITRLILCLTGIISLAFIYIWDCRKFSWTSILFFLLLSVLGAAIVGYYIGEIKIIVYLERILAEVFPLFPVELLEKNINKSEDLWKELICKLMQIYKDTKSLEMRKRNAEIASLSSQINPHFLYNTLESIRSEAIFHNDNAAANMAEALGNFFRYNISRKEDIVSVADELDNIRNYIHIQKYRFRERLDFRVVYKNEKNLINIAQIPKLSLQPLVENAVFHGIEKRVNGGCVTIILTASDHCLWILIEDDGPGMDEEDTRKLNQQIREGRIIHKASERQGGIALVNVHSRIQMIFGNPYGIVFSSVKGCGTQVELTLPYKVIGT